MSLAERRSWRDAEIAFLESLRPEYEEKGYRFVVHPQRSDLPAFLAPYQPDAIATKDDHNIAIEVKSRVSSANNLSIRRIRKFFEGQPNWRLRVIYMGSDFPRAPGLPKADWAAIMAQTAEIGFLAHEGSMRAAFVLAWGLLEATLNAVQPDADARPRPPGAVVQALAMNGHIPHELEAPLRARIDMRDRILHGDLTAEPTDDDVRTVLAAVHAALGQPLAGSAEQS